MNYQKPLTCCICHTKMKYADGVYHISNSYSLYFCHDCNTIAELTIKKLSKVIQNR